MSAETTGHRSATILDPLRRHAETDPDKLLYAFTDGRGRIRASYSYGQFVERTNDVARHLTREGAVGRGDRLLLVYPPGIEILCAFFACVRLGAIPVPVCPPSSHALAASLDRMNAIARDCVATAVLTDRACFWSMKVRALQSRFATVVGGSRQSDPTSALPWIVTPDAPRHDGEEVCVAPSEILFLQYTSGSTRDPRGVMVSHRNVLANCAGVFDHQPVGVSWLPQYHDMGLIGSCLFIAIAGGTTYLSSPIDFLERPVSWLEALSRFSATASAAPSFAYELCLRTDKVPDEDLESIDLGSLQLLMNGAEPVRADVFRRFQERFAPCGLRAEVLCAAYGLAEHTLAVSNRGTDIVLFDPARIAAGEAVRAEETAGVETTALVSCGHPVGDTEILIVDVSGPPAEAPPGAIGEIWVDGPSKGLGYWGRPELTRETFAAQIETGRAEGQGWLKTGDLGLLHDGELFVCGRRKDLIIVRGLNYYPQDIEAIVEEDPAVRRGCVAAFAVERDGREVLVVVAELRTSRSVPCTDDLSRQLIGRLGIMADRFAFVRKRTIPKTTSGKIMRHQARRRWLDNELDVIAHVECATPDVGSKLDTGGTGDHDDAAAVWGTPDAVDRTFHRRGLLGTEDATLADVGLDSLALVELASDVSRHLEAAGATDLEHAADVRWLQRIPIADLVELLHQVTGAAPLARLRFGRAFALVRAEQQRLEHALMREDACLPLTGLPAESRVQSAPARRGILLTGGTGFFGPFMLRSLLEQCDDPLYVLVRASDPMHAMDRLERAIGSLGPTMRTPRLERWRDRVTPVCGDLSRRGLGLTRRDWSLLAADTHAIYHNGALVNYLLDYSSLRAPNVIGTHELLRLAADQGGKAFNYVSTTFVFGWSTRETLFEEDRHADLDLLDFGYSQSKWSAEQIVLSALRQGLPGRVFRPALIAPSICGGGENFDIAMRLLTFMLKHGIGTTAQNQVSFSPADLVADNIVAISHLPDTVGQTFHVTRDEHATMQDITDLLGERTGTDFTHYALPDFVPKVVSRCTSDDLLFPLLNFLVRSVDKISAMEFKLYDNRNYRRARERSPFGREDQPLEDVVDGIVRFMRRHRLIEAGSPDPVALDG